MQRWGSDMQCGDALSTEIQEAGQGRRHPSHHLRLLGASRISRDSFFPVGPEHHSSIWPFRRPCFTTTPKRHRASKTHAAGSLLHTYSTSTLSSSQPHRHSYNTCAPLAVEAAGSCSLFGSPNPP
jgi:hypothetical protein